MCVYLSLPLAICLLTTLANCTRMDLGKNDCISSPRLCDTTDECSLLLRLWQFTSPSHFLRLVVMPCNTPTKHTISLCFHVLNLISRAAGSCLRIPPQGFAYRMNNLAVLFKTVLVYDIYCTLPRNVLSQGVVNFASLNNNYGAFIPPEFCSERYPS